MSENRYRWVLTQSRDEKVPDFWTRKLRGGGTVAILAHKGIIRFRHVNYDFIDAEFEYSRAATLDELKIGIDNFDLVVGKGRE